MIGGVLGKAYYGLKMVVLAKVRGHQHSERCAEYNHDDNASTSLSERIRFTSEERRSQRARGIGSRHV